MLCRDSTAAVAALLMAAGSAAAQPGYGDYLDWTGWARVQPHMQPGLASSYDRSGGNADYSQYEWPEGPITDEIVCTVKTIDSPGVLHRFWMPHAASDSSFVVRLFFDGEPTPRIDTTSDALFAGSFSHITPPLVDTCAGGQVCYEPIPFAESLRIESVNHQLPTTRSARHKNYYHYTYQAYPPGTPLTSYTSPLSVDDQAARDHLVSMLNQSGQHPAGSSPTAVRVTTPSTAIPAGGTQTLGQLTGPGTIRQLNVRMDLATDVELDGMWLRVRYDGDTAAAIHVPVSEFFGAGHQRAVYSSLPIGTDSADGFYCYWPMPFRESAEVELCNSTGLPIDLDSAVVEYKPGPVPADMSYLHVERRTSVFAWGDPPHQILTATGRGHYVGNLLYLDQDLANLYMLEGDELITVDGTVTLKGTGLEDAYNGGFYYNWVAVQPDEPEGPNPQSATRPLSGILYMDLDSGAGYARADQYRWQIGDRVSFASSIDVSIENLYSSVGSRWTSVAFWYEQPSVPGDVESDGDVDLADFASLQRCFVSPDATCLTWFDADNSGVLDSTDVETFTGTMAGPW
ncbi:MAG: DUF2961 domain-containing protein [bacterium]|nr:DUF2961 domain-containing protein [bacterium]